MKSQEKANYKPLILGQDELTRAAEWLAELREGMPSRYSDT